MEEIKIEKKEISKTNIKKEIIEWVICFVIAYIIYILINYYVGTISGVKQVSMYPTAKEGDKVIISRRIISPKPFLRGQIITFEAPNESENINTSNIAEYTEKKGFSKFINNVIGIGKKSYIKRIIGLPGDKIHITEDGNVYLNDKKLDEKYLNEVRTFRTGKYYDLIVPEGCLFVMGDNRLQSKDSREFGAVPFTKVEGNVIYRVWPFNKMGVLEK